MVEHRLMTSPEKQNQQAWDDLVRSGSSFANPATAEDFTHPDRVINPFGWIPEPIAGQRVLCLAAGGGRHGPVFAAQGAEATIVDLSEAMLALDREVAQREGLSVMTLQTSMCDLSDLGDCSFDVVLQPVSTCYVENLRPMFQEVSRVMKAGGIYVSQHKQPISLQAGAMPGANGAYQIREPYYRSGPLPPVSGSEHREAGAQEFLHTLEAILGGLCAQGFTIHDVREPRHADPSAPKGSFRERSHFVPPYIAIKALRDASAPPSSPLWMPS
ncbi:MAG: Ubiquinone/menaquinone biosynthesis C-methyltransferase UbiE [Verrucomicrobia subdivision 3 bacterium]|nr:Ubiquinone/menaquinone biosynthesis C-methyltransferase UbiE [Limisphaerales bacterium]MCS1415264.1 Ubiquinone/menaquinone biosynthesis C-methyltransferase UbiE [Limisphaerales bacterium]